MPYLLSEDLIHYIIRTTKRTYSKCPMCGYFAFDGEVCWDCGYTAY